MKKIIISLLLIITVLFATVALSSCENGQKTDSINGETPDVAFAKAMSTLDSTDKFSINLSLDAEINVLFVPVYGVEVDNFCTYLYNGNDQFFEISQTATDTLAEKNMSYVIDGYDDAIWYVDGMCYINNDGVKEKFESTTSPIAENPYIKAITEIVAENKDSIQCYVDGDKYYFTVELKDASETKMGLGASKELYRIYFNSDGTLDKFHVECTVKTLGLVKFDAQYSYTDIPEINPPADANSYVEQ